MPNYIPDNKYLVEAGKILYGHMFKGVLNGEVILLGNKKADMNKVNKMAEKLKKKEKILSIATLTDQLNLIAGVLAEQIEVKPENERTELEKKALKIYKSIQNVLNS